MASQGFERPTAGSERTHAKIEQALEDILASVPFRNSQQAQRLVRYVVERSIAHEDHLLRERVIGSVVFGRPADYDTGNDPVVRIRASEVRKRLAQYYQSTPAEPPVVIEIPPGSYHARFRWRHGKGETELATPDTSFPASQVLQEPPALQEPQLAGSAGDLIETGPAAPSVPAILPVISSRRPAQRVVLLLLAILLPCFVAAAAWRVWHPGGDALTTFWKPWTGNREPVLISIGSNAVYRLSDDMMAPYRAAHHLQGSGEDFFLPLVPDATVKGKDIVPQHDSFVALGDVAAVSTVVSRLTAQHQGYQERFPNDISFVELRNSPSVLVGGFNNPMTLELTRKLPFVMASTTELDDTVHGRQWVLHASEDSHDTQDYAIITRLVAHGSDGPVLSIAGMGQYGTLAAANFVVNPQSMATLAKQLPPDWPKRNLQVVLHLQVVDFEPTAVKVVGVQVW